MEEMLDRLTEWSTRTPVLKHTENRQQLLVEEHGLLGIAHVDDGFRSVSKSLLC